MRILLTHTWFMCFDPKQQSIMEPYAPLATLQLAAVLREDRHEVCLHDVTFETSPQAIEAVLLSWQPEVLIVCDDGFNYLSKMCLTNMREAGWVMCSLAKQRGCTVIVSSSDATDHIPDYLNQSVDYIVWGEAEQTFRELLAALAEGHPDPEQIDGLAWKQDGVVKRSKPRALIANLDRLPMPAWDLADLKKYQQAWRNKHGYFSINCSTTRGCPFKCNWCAKPIYGNRYHARSPEHVVTELQFLMERFGFDYVWFCDDIFGLKPGWVKRFAELLQEKNLRFRFKIQSRADLLLKDEQVAPLAAAGCDIVWMGAESGSQKILDAMDKGITLEEIEKATKALRTHGIKPAFFLQFGYPGERMEDIRATLNLLSRLQPEEIGISVSYPLPGTRFYESVRAGMGEKSNWTDSDELQLMFRNYYSPAFYKQLHRHVHNHFRVLRTQRRIADHGPARKGLTAFWVGSLLRLPYHRWKAMRSGWRLKKLEQQHEESGQ